MKEIDYKFIAKVHDLLAEAGEKGLRPSQLVHAYNQGIGDQNRELVGREMGQLLRDRHEITKLREPNGNIKRYIYFGKIPLDFLTIPAERSEAGIPGAAP